jgi:predicted acetyltransferase
VILRPQNDEDTIVAEELAFLNANAFKGVLGFIYNFAGKYPTFKITAPTFLNLRLFVSEPYDVEIKNICFGMTRIVNAALAFQTLDMSGAENSIAVKVNDDFLNWNNSTFLITGQRGKTEVQVTHSKPDMTCDVRTLSQILTGYLSLEEAEYLGLCEITDNKQALLKVFKTGVPCIYDEF